MVFYSFALDSIVEFKNQGLDPNRCHTEAVHPKRKYAISDKIEI